MNKTVQLEEEIRNRGNVPRHIAIIMDGNGRWANSKGLPRVAGHRAGVDTVRKIVEACSAVGVKYLTLYTFSTENWKRPRMEVATLMKLLLRTLKKEIEELHKNDVRLTSIGDFSKLPESVQAEFKDAFRLTAGNKKLTLTLALSYSGRWELAKAVNQIVRDVRSGKINEEITEKLISGYLETAELPDPDLVIRTSGEFRVSNFLLWQIAYSEFYITEKYWPDFSKDDFYSAIINYQQRERRFGKVSSQVAPTQKGLVNDQE